MATIMKPHGIHGELSCKLHTSVIGTVLNSLESVFININEQLVPFFIHCLSYSAKVVWIKLDDVNSIDSAKYFSGREIFLPKNILLEYKLTETMQGGLKGYKVIDENGYEYGNVKEIIEYPGQILFEITHRDKEFLVPVNEAIIKSIDEKMKVIVVELPEGLTEL